MRQDGRYLDGIFPLPEARAGGAGVLVGRKVQMVWIVLILIIVAELCLWHAHGVGHLLSILACTQCVRAFSTGRGRQGDSVSKRRWLCKNFFLA